MNPYTLTLYVGLAVMLVGMLFLLAGMFVLAKVRIGNMKAPWPSKAKKLVWIGLSLYVPASIAAIIAVFTAP